MTAPFDSGLQPERTLLAWRRTCLTFGLASAVALRLTFDAVGWAALVLGGSGVLLAGLAYLAVWRRYDRTNQALALTGFLAAGAAPLAMASGAALAVGVTCATFVVAW